MSPAEHYDEAETLLSWIEKDTRAPRAARSDPNLVERWAKLALIHATLACRQL